jgi:predicted glutamine amidotransferase
MCKLLIMTGLKNPELAVKMIQAAKNPMSVGNNMGIGFSAVKNDGEFFTERWHKNDMFMDTSKVLTPEIIQQLEPFKDRLPPLEQNYSLHGVKDFSNITSITMHTRYATCGREFFNTHPFVDQDHSLVHNGVIYNAHSLNLNKISTCDSEAALQSYINHGVAHDINNTQAWLDTLSGYWAFGIFSRDRNGNRILDVIRNDATLYATNIEGFGLVLATMPDIINSSAIVAGVDIQNQPELMKSNIMYRFNAVTGELITKLEVNDSKLNFKSNYYSTPDFEKVTGIKSRTISSPTLIKEVEPIVEDDFDTGFAFHRSLSYSMDMSMIVDIMQDTNIPLRDRLDIYDQEFQCDTGFMFDRLPSNWRDDAWQFQDLFDVAEEIETCYDVYSSAGFKSSKR